MSEYIKIQRNESGQFTVGHFSPKGENSPSWKGDNITYYALHAWVKNNLGKASFCSFDKTHVAKRYEWASKSHQAKRNLGDYFSLCVSCHKRYDYDHKLNERNKIIKQRAESGLKFTQIAKEFSLTSAQIGNICR